MKALLAALVALAAAPAFAQNAPVMAPPVSSRGVAPAAADRALGMAILSAQVKETGVLMGGSGAVSAALTQPGSYSVTFERPVTGCTLTASAGQVETSGAHFTILANPAYSADAKVVTVFTRDPRDLSQFNAAFHLIVFCAK
jgi:hypothetical protein